ncbi:polyamine ABC transporter substrate-binding protein [Novispirillum sp. DQ9]|uniref:polyamine ABC transporter substrate-binding protein n=1 Tax=Novispirillum sp. DQ9 TaxID=3398612 RepID=UPI003C7E850E
MKHVRGLLAGAVAATVLGWVSGAMAAEEPKLNIYNWSDYIAEDTIAKFEAETGIKVTYDVYDSNEVLEAKLLAGRSGYDLVVPTGTFLERQIKAGIYQPLDRAKLSNYGNLDPKIMKEAAAHDAGNAHAIVYMWGTNGYGWNPEKVAAAAGADAPTDSWKLVFDPEWAAKVSKCGLYVLDSPSEILPLALNYLGLDPHSQSPEDLKKAEELLVKVAPYVTKFHSSEYINALASGDACVAVGFSGDVFIARSRAEESGNNIKINYTIPTEGTIMWFDMMAIPKDAPHPENAHKFIDFVMRPEITAGITNFVWYANANTKALPMVDEEVRNDPGVFPPPEVMERLFSNVTPDQAVERLRTRAWSRIKTGK